MDSLRSTNILAYTTADFQSFLANMCTLVFHFDLFDTLHFDHKNHMDLSELVLLVYTEQMRLQYIQVGNYNSVCDLKHHSEHFLFRKEKWIR